MKELEELLSWIKEKEIQVWGPGLWSPHYVSSQALKNKIQEIINRNNETSKNNT